MHEIVAGSTDQSIDIFIGDSSSTTGVGLTGLVYNTSGLTCYYRKGATGTMTALSLATQTVGGTHTDGGFVEIDSTNAPGMYRLDLSDTIVADDNDRVIIYLQGATNMAPCVVGIRTAPDIDSSVDPVLWTWEAVLGTPFMEYTGNDSVSSYGSVSIDRDISDETADAWVQATVNDSGGSTINTGVLLDVGDNNERMALTIDGAGTVELYIWSTGGIPTFRDSYASGITSDAVLKLTYDGSAYNGYVNGILRVSSTESRRAGRMVGVVGGSGSTSSEISDFSCSLGSTTFNEASAGTRLSGTSVIDTDTVLGEMYSLLVSLPSLTDITAVVQPGDYPTTITYGGTAPNGEIETVTWNSGAVWTYTYDGSDQLTSVAET